MMDDAYHIILYVLCISPSSSTPCQSAALLKSKFALSHALNISATERERHKLMGARDKHAFTIPKLQSHYRTTGVAMTIS